MGGNCAITLACIQDNQAKDNTGYESAPLSTVSRKVLLAEQRYQKNINITHRQLIFHSQMIYLPISTSCEAAALQLTLLKSQLNTTFINTGSCMPRTKLFIDISDVF